MLPILTERYEPMLNAFTHTQISLIEDMAGDWWENHQAKTFDGLPFETMLKLKRQYVDSIIDGLRDPEIWGYSGYRDS